jgi:hypothetical protein
MSTRAIVAREARRNLGRNRGAVVSVVLAVGLGACLVGLALEWSVLVGEAQAVANSSFFALSVATQLDLRAPLVVAAVVVAEAIALPATTLAMRQRRRNETGFFETTLGAPAAYTKTPALVEGLGQGLAGGLIATAVALIAVPTVTRGERSTVPKSYTLTVTQGSLPPRKMTHILDVNAIRLTAGHLGVIAVVIVGFAAVLGLFNAFVTLSSPRGDARADELA